MFSLTLCFAVVTLSYDPHGSGVIGAVVFALIAVLSWSAPDPNLPRQRATISVLLIHFCATGLVYLSRSIDVAASITRHFSSPVMFSQSLLLTIWLATARQPLVLRAVMWLSGIIFLFCLASADWFARAIAWNNYSWFAYFGSTGARILFAVPGFLTVVATPLLILRRKRADPETDLATRHLLIAVACICVASGLLFTMSPDSSWPLNLMKHSIRFVDDLVVFVLFVFRPTIIYSVVAFVSMWCARHVAEQRLKVIALAIVVPLTLAIVDALALTWLVSRFDLTALNVMKLALDFFIVLLTVAGTIWALKGVPHVAVTQP